MNQGALENFLSGQSPFGPISPKNARLDSQTDGKNQGKENYLAAVIETICTKQLGTLKTWIAFLESLPIYKKQAIWKTCTALPAFANYDEKSFVATVHKWDVNPVNNMSSISVLYSAIVFLNSEGLLPEMPPFRKEVSNRMQPESTRGMLQRRGPAKNRFAQPLSVTTKKVPIPLSHAETMKIKNQGQELTVCYGCRQWLRYPSGAEVIRCPKCTKISYPEQGKDKVDHITVSSSPLPPSRPSDHHKNPLLWNQTTFSNGSPVFSRSMSGGHVEHDIPRATVLKSQQQQQQQQNTLKRSLSDDHTRRNKKKKKSEVDKEPGFLLSRRPPQSALPPGLTLPHTPIPPGSSIPLPQGPNLSMLHGSSITSMIPNSPVSLSQSSNMSPGSMTNFSMSSPSLSQGMTSSPTLSGSPRYTSRTPPRYQNTVPYLGPDMNFVNFNMSTQSGLHHSFSSPSVSSYKMEYSNGRILPQLSTDGLRNLQLPPFNHQKTEELQLQYQPQSQESPFTLQQPESIQIIVEPERKLE
eukprot:TRINITY_DN1684_c0_g2_i1.p1 TRINITY_DN1684_c0_g2~~TRINITY_DN1684_c0_g2_i1.p1  ORF type:complete len:536 (-),score=107.59 TRINITY_DN1684_c0_g2_i1:28-1599(-)